MRTFILMLGVLLFSSTLIACGSSTQENYTTPSSGTLGEAVQPENTAVNTTVQTDANGNLECPRNGMSDQSSPELAGLIEACLKADSDHFPTNWKRIVVESNDGGTAVVRVIGNPISCPGNCPPEVQDKVTVFLQSNKMWSSGGGFGNSITASDEVVAAAANNQIENNKLVIADKVVPVKFGRITVNVNLPDGKPLELDLVNYTFELLAQVNDGSAPKVLTPNWQNLSPFDFDMRPVDGLNPGDPGTVVTILSYRIDSNGVNGDWIPVN